MDGCMYSMIILIYTLIKIIYSFFQIFISCLQATFSLATLVPNIQAFAEGSASGAYVFQIIGRQSKINIFDDKGEIPSKFTGDIEFKNVHFTYPSRQDASVNN